MSKPRGLCADIHLHNWSQFSTIATDGVNSRLAALHGELMRCALRTKQAGGNKMVIAGDLFHVRGQMAPSVLNPTLDLFHEIREMGLEVIILAGNHDLEGKHSERLGSAITALESLGCTVIHKTTVIDDMVLVPWFDSIADLKKELQAQQQNETFDLIIHAPINGTIMGIPDHGLEPQWLADLGFKRVFAGHYHHHKDFCGGKVWSIGALAHHSWSDVGSEAGFCIIRDEDVEHFPSELPSFIDVTPEMHADDVKKLAPGNFMRVKVATSKIAEIDAMKTWLTQQGALGVIALSVKPPVEAREGGVAATVSAGASIGASVSEFIKTKTYARPEAVSLRASRVLAEAEIA